VTTTQTSDIRSENRPPPRRGDPRGLALSAFAAVALFCMALPWVQISCGGQTILEQSGYQVMTGSGTVSPESRAGARAEEAMQKRERDDEADAAWWLGLVVASTVVVGVQGYRITRTGHGHAPAAAAAPFGAVVLSVALAIGLPAERLVDDLHDSVVSGQLRRDDARVGAAVSSIQAERSPGPWLMLLTLWLQAGFAAYIHLDAGTARAPSRLGLSLR